MPSQAMTAFLTSLENVEELLDIHGNLQAAPGRRHNQEALHRAGVVMSVAAWDGYVESVVLECFTKLQTTVTSPQAPAWALTSFRLHETAAAEAAKATNTPNAENVKRLFEKTLGFDPWPAWTWKSAAGTTTSVFVRERMNQCLKVRHAIAHGSALPLGPSYAWLLNSSHTPRLPLALLKGCKSFFGRVVDATDGALSGHFASRHRLPAPW